MTYESCAGCQRLIENAIYHPYSIYETIHVKVHTSTIDGKTYCADCTEKLKAERGTTPGTSIVVKVGKIIEVPPYKPTSFWSDLVSLFTFSATDKSQA